ncbi:MAG: flagellar protein FlaG [Chloroflexota bacterium]|jgi:flagellar protein FlaG
MALDRGDAVQPVAPIVSDRTGIDNFSSMPFGTLTPLARQRTPEQVRGNQELPEENPPQPEMTEVELALAAQRAKLVFEKHETTGKIVARLKDPETGEVIRQIPPEEMLKLAEAIDKYLGLLVDRQS